MSSFLWGISVLTILIGSHPSESRQVLLSLDVPINYLEVISQPIVLAASIGVSGLFAVMNRSSAWFLSICTIGLTMMLPLPIAFGIYFIGQHSLQAWSHLTHRFQSNEKAIWIEATPFTVGAYYCYLDVSGTLSLSTCNQNYLLLSVPVSHFLIYCVWIHSIDGKTSLWLLHRIQLQIRLFNPLNLMGDPTKIKMVPFFKVQEFLTKWRFDRQATVLTLSKRYQA